MEQINIERAEQIVSEIKTYINGNKRLEELFASQPTMKMDVYQKTSNFYAQRKYEEHQASNEAVPHGFYAILEREIKSIGLLQTIKKYNREINLIAETMNMDPIEIKKILKDLRPGNSLRQDTMAEQNARNELKELFRRFTSKYKENFIKRIVDEKNALLQANTIKIEKEKEVEHISKNDFITWLLINPSARESIISIINKKFNKLVNVYQLKDILVATFDPDYMEKLKQIFGIQKPASFERFQANKHYVRLKRNFEPKLNELFKDVTPEERTMIVQIINYKAKLKILSQKQEDTHENKTFTTKSIRKIKALLKVEHQQLIEEISTLMAESNCNLILVGKKFVFDIEARITKDEEKECREYIAQEKQISSFHNYIYPMYIKQNNLIKQLVTKSPTPLSSNEENYQINADVWFTKEKIEQAIDLIDRNKLDSMPEENFKILKKFLLEDGLLWAYVADNIDLNIFTKIINNFDSIIACCNKEDITIDNLHDLIKKANLYDYANDLIIGLVGQDITAKVINYNQFSGVTVTDEIIHKRLRKLVDLAVRSERITKSSLPFGCDVRLGEYKLQRYKNNEPSIFTSGIDTKTCFFISVNENDFFFYSLLNKNGYVIKITDSKDRLLARATCFRKNNVLMINGIRCRNNKVNPESQEETKQMIEIVKLVKLMSEKMIELTTQDTCPIDYVVCNKAGILENSELENYFQFENINADLFREPINVYDEDWQEFVHTYDGQEQLLQEVPSNPESSFTTDFGNHYPAILITSRNYMALISPRDISLKDQAATYRRPRRSIEEYISAELTEEIIARINRIRALSCFTGTPEEQEEKKKNYRLIKDKKEIKSLIIGDDWCILINPNNTYDVYFANYTTINKQEVQRYISRLLETITPNNIEELKKEDLIPKMEDGVKIYAYPLKKQ